MKLASGFCIPEPLGIKGRQVHPLIRFLLQSRVDEKCADLHKPFISYLFLVVVTVQSAASLSTAIPLGSSTKRVNSKRANHGRSCLFQDAVSSVSFWLRSFPVRGWQTQSLSSVSGLPTRPEYPRRIFAPRKPIRSLQLQWRVYERRQKIRNNNGG